LVELLMSRMTVSPSLPGYRGYGRIGGCFYANVSMSISLEALAGISPRRFAALVGPVSGKLPPIEEIPRPRLPRWKAIRVMVPAVMVCGARASQKRMPQFLAGAPSRCERLRAETELAIDAD
jgi:pyruvate,water dikinase